MAFIFTMRSTPVNGSVHRRDQSIPGSLPAIDEDNASFITPSNAPPVPPRAWNRPHRQLALGFPRGWDDVEPPAYNQFDDRGVKGPNGEKLAELRKGVVENRHIAKRGGWRRFLILLLVLLLLAIGLGVGLGVGLKKKKSASSNSSDTSSSSSTTGGASGTAQTPPSDPDTPANSTFPTGSYTFNTYLNTVATSCTSNPSTWMCYPYSTYAQSPSSSAATFDWIIRSSSPTNHTISSTPNPFSVLFTNTPLRLMKEGQEDEHYFFQLNMSKPTKPTTQLGKENVAATCYFDDTTLQAYLYTKMQKTYPKNETGESGGFQPWPGAVKIEQVTGGRVGSPRCIGPGGDGLGEFGVEDGTQLCDCLWLNTGT